MATMAFDASASAVPFSSETISDWQFYTGHGLTCATPGMADSTGSPSYGPMLTSTPFPYVDYPYTLKVIDSSAAFNCAEFTARAWSNLPPTVEITTVPPARPGGNRDRVFLVDWDGDGVAMFDLTVKCLDPDSAVDQCIKDVDNLDDVYFFPDNSVLADTVNEFSAKVTMLQTGSTPNIDIFAVDEWADDWGPLDFSNPFFGEDGVDVAFIPFVDNALIDDSPACQSGLVWALKNTQLDYKPDDPAPGYPTLCADPDPAEFPTPLLYEVEAGDNADASDGFLDGAANAYAFSDPAPDHLEYVPGTDEVGLDTFNYEVGEAIDTGFQSTEVNLFVRVIECDSPGVIFEVVDGESPVSPTTREGCIGVVATDSEVTSPTIFRGGEKVILGNGFSVATGTTLTIEIQPSLITDG
jgi:hypothetical protein